MFVHDLIVAGSVEERMLRLQKLADAVLENGAPIGGSLTENDLEDLLAPLAT